MESYDMRPFVSGFFHSGKCFQRFIHVPACMKTSFLFMTKQYSAYMDLQRFVFSFLTDGHLGCLHFLAVMNYAAINIYVHVFVCTCFQFSWMCIVSRIARSYANSVFNFLTVIHLKLIFVYGMT